MTEEMLAVIAGFFFVGVFVSVIVCVLACAFCMVCKGIEALSACKKRGDKSC